MTTSFADVMASESGMETALALADEMQLIGEHLDSVRGETRRASGKIVNRPLHFQFWKMCQRPTCQISGHIERRGYIIPGPHENSVSGETLVKEFAESTHGTPLPQFGVYSSFSLDEQKHFSLGAFTDHNPRMPFNEFTPMIDIRREGEDAVAPGVERAPGGLHHFPVKQLREYRFHHNPIVKAIRPDACEEPDYTCEWCGNSYPVKAHKISHTQSAHPAMVQSLVQADVLKDALVGPMSELVAQGANSVAVQALLAQLIDKISSPEPARRGRPPGSKNADHSPVEEEE